jgi:hypothetical protein
VNAFEVSNYIEKFNFKAFLLNNLQLELITIINGLAVYYTSYYELHKRTIYIVISIKMPALVFLVLISCVADVLAFVPLPQLKKGAVRSKSQEPRRLTGAGGFSFGDEIASDATARRQASA